ncbi:glycosyl hydrolase [Silvimonas iriomotensis]|uniref:Asl1-like glycosyl hydrolase catalytic domain-containing protein n=1 Tax=Silvimonas iriomotensis TaxID=449662 RepID=A0ABQ2PF02_9NEIS|nr:glycosyl hydrolase [Silvimonas iriomotensis]GGP23841.1 hypothetical protein GCM10010970_38410 [Silvimonas iriomotensis]
MMHRLPPLEDPHRLRWLILLIVTTGLYACGGDDNSSTPSSSSMSSSLTASSKATSSVTPVPTGTSKSTKRGIAGNLGIYPADLTVVSSGVSWWYNWTLKPSSNVPADYLSAYQMEFIPMIRTGDFVDQDVINWLLANPSVKYLLVLNEPNKTKQANMNPWSAVVVWPRFEAIARQTGVKLVGPAMTMGDMLHYNDPVAWLDSFIADYNAVYHRDPQMDFLAFHWYDYGLAAALDRLDKYGKQIWVTEFDNFHYTVDGTQIDTEAKQLAQQADMVKTLETRSDVFRYAWYTDRVSGNPHFINLLADPGQLTNVGSQYVSLPWVY